MVKQLTLTSNASPSDQPPLWLSKGRFGHRPKRRATRQPSTKEFVSCPRMCCIVTQQRARFAGNGPNGVLACGRSSCPLLNALVPPHWWVVRCDRFFQSLIRERSWEMFAAIMFDDYYTSFDFSAKYSNAMIRWQRAGVHSTYMRTISHRHRYLFRIVFSYSWLLASRDQQLMMHNWSAPTRLNDAHRC